MIKRLLMFQVFFVATLFGSAGRFDLPWFWALLIAANGVLLLGLLVVDPELRAERLNPGPGDRDRKTPRIARVILLAHYIVAGIDVGRFGWSEMPVLLQGAGLLGYVGFASLGLWAMRTNRFFSSAVRIQEDRGQEVITTGPYRFVRHPGYVGVFGGMFCGALALGSWWGMIPLIPLVPIFLSRTIVEDRMLLEELPGYRDYALRVRARLLPGIW